ncbi:MAG: cobalt transporter CbiM [Deltaproteobacteria bacterium]|nr:cobalt transporter CbiM [Deltaproteobacteria bacterium]MBW2137787.1 cobalt transporter CbiM [Deltaproteobacteria bacterium]
MHISEGVLSGPVLISGALLTATGTGIGLTKVDYDRITHVAVMTAGFFVASLVHVPIGPASVHLILNGLMGVFLGWGAFPGILVALFLQAVLFQFGGLTSLGVNCLNMAFPSVICYYLFQKGLRSRDLKVFMSASFLCGFVAVFLGAIMVALSLSLTGEAFRAAARILVAAHFPVMIIEGLITMFCIKFLRSVRPEILELLNGK